MMNGVVTVITFIDKLKYARQSELQVQAELEHIERLHRIMRLPNRSAVYAAELAEKLAALERRLNNSIDLAVDRKNEALNILDNLEGDTNSRLYKFTLDKRTPTPRQTLAQFRFTLQQAMFFTTHNTRLTVSDFVTQATFTAD